MGLFGGGSTKYETDVERATNENNTSEDWAIIMDICDKAGKSSEEAKNYLKAILKRLANLDPHISIQAVILLDACVKNSGKHFHLEIASRDFENEYVKLLQKSHPKVMEKLKESLKRWAEEDTFKNDPQLNLISSLYVKLKNEGVDFTTETPTKKTVTLSKDPNVVQSQEEEDQIAKAIELSLKDASSSPRNYSSISSSLYPSTNLASSTASAVPQKEPRKVRALYDFEAAEDNELTFNSGELILVTDDSDPNWWKGTNHRGEGLFPANFVSLDLNAEPEIDKKKKSEIEEDNASGSSSAKQLKELENVEINEEKIDRLLHLFHEADPTTNSDKDAQEMQNLEREVNTMGPLIDTELERIDRKYAQLTKLSSDLVEALNLYHTLMPEPQITSVSKVPFIGYPPGLQPLHSMYNGNMPPSMLPSSMMGPPFASLPPDHARQFIVPQNMPLPHFPPGIQPPPGHMMHQHHMASMQPMSGMPPHSMPPQGLPPGLHHPGPQQAQTMHRIPPQSIQQGPFPPHHGIPNFPPGSMPPNFPQNGPHMTQTPVQNGPPGGQSANYPQTSNTHIM